MSGIEITQADREAAADSVKAYRGRKDNDWQKRIRDGKCDDGTMVQAFARHRHEARAEALEEAKTAVRYRMVAQEWPPQDGDQQIDEVVEAIDALRSDEREG